MREKYLDADAFYMNPITGCVARGKELMNDFYDEKEKNSDLTWFDWNQAGFFQVLFSEDDEWVEV